MPTATGNRGGYGGRPGGGGPGGGGSDSAHSGPAGVGGGGDRAGGGNGGGNGSFAGGGTPPMSGKGNSVTADAAMAAKQGVTPGDYDKAVQDFHNQHVDAMNQDVPSKLGAWAARVFGFGEQDSYDPSFMNAAWDRSIQRAKSPNGIPAADNSANWGVDPVDALLGVGGLINPAASFAHMFYSAVKALTSYQGPQISLGNNVLGGSTPANAVGVDNGTARPTGNQVGSDQGLHRPSQVTGASQVAAPPAATAPAGSASPANDSGTLIDDGTLVATGRNRNYQKLLGVTGSVL